MEYTRKLAEFCAGVKFGELPPAVVHKAKQCLLDYVANVYGSLELDAVRRVAEYVRGLGGPEECAALGCGFRTGRHSAAFINGTTGEAVEGQDGLRFGGNHPGTAVIPAALSIAECKGAGGREVIEAVVAGYEAANRVAAAMHPHHTLAGFLPTGTCGAFGAAAAASRLMGHDPENMLSSISNAGLLSPVSMAEHLMAGSESKIVQGGQAASAGLTAAGLAEAGISGPPFTLEGSHLKGGFTKITTNSAPNLEKITEGLGEKYTISQVYFKPFTACRHTHGAVQAVIELHGSETFDPGDVESVEVATYAIAAVAVGKQVSAGDTFVSAQFSLPYTVAASIVDGDMGPVQLKESRISDPRILELAGKVKIKIDGELNGVYPEYTSTRVEIGLAGGKELVTQVDIPKGDPRAPLSDEELAEKLARFAPGRDGEQLGSISEKILRMEEIENINELTALV